MSIESSIKAGVRSLFLTLIGYVTLDGVGAVTLLYLANPNTPESYTILFYDFILNISVYLF